MPWTLPDSADSYLELLRAIDRPRVRASTSTPSTSINSPAKFYDNAGLLRECFAKLGPHIRSVHAKDIVLEPRADGAAAPRCGPGWARSTTACC